MADSNLADGSWLSAISQKCGVNGCETCPHHRLGVYVPACSQTDTSPCSVQGLGASRLNLFFKKLTCYLLRSFSINFVFISIGKDSTIGIISFVFVVIIQPRILLFLEYNIPHNRIIKDNPVFIVSKFLPATEAHPVKYKEIERVLFLFPGHKEDRLSLTIILHRHGQG